MTTAVEAVPEVVPARERQRRYAIVLACIVALSLALYAWGIGRADLRNVFFAIGVRSMSHSFTGFLFGAWDPAGIMSLDKPPMAFWPQVLSVKIFGFHGWALVLPQVIEGGLAVFLLHRTVRRWAGENVALLAAALLALTPVTVVISRTNNTDTLLMLWCVAAAYALMRAVQPEASDRSARLWLMQAALWIGCAFTTKMLAGWLVIPAIVLAYVFGRRSSWPRRAVDLLCGAAVLAVSSLWWVLLTTFWPGDKPFAAGSTTGSTWNLVFVQNGWDRIFGATAAAPPPAQGGGSTGGGGFSPAAANVVTIGKAIGAAFNGGDLGLSRIFGRTVGGQVTWLLPLALLVLVVVAVSWIWRGVSDRVQLAGWTLFGVWIIVAGLILSFEQGTYHAYYTTQMAPAIAAVAAAGLAILWRHRLWFLLPVGVAGTAVWTWVLVSRDTGYYGWLRYVAAGLAVVAVIGLVVRRFGRSVVALPTAVVGLAALLVAPAVWSVDAAVHPATGFADGAIPTAGPAGWSFGAAASVPGALQDFLRTGELPGGSLFSSDKLAPKQRQLLDYVQRNAGDAEITLAVEGGGLRAENYAANTDKTVVAMGGFDGVDPVPGVGQLDQWKRDHRVAFVLSQPPKPGFGDFGNTPNALKRMAWVQQNCAAVPSTEYGVPVTPPTQVSTLASLVGFGEQTLYRC